MNAEFFEALELLEKEKGIPKEYMLEKIEAALTGALKREIGGSGNIRISLDPNKKDMKVYRVRTVVEEITDEYNQLTLDQAKAIAKRYKLFANLFPRFVLREKKAVDINSMENILYDFSQIFRLRSSLVKRAD